MAYRDNLATFARALHGDAMKSSMTATMMADMDKTRRWTAAAALVARAPRR